MGAKPLLAPTFPLPGAGSRKLAQRKLETNRNTTGISLSNLLIERYFYR